MFTDPKLEPAIREIVERRLNVGGGDCLISVKLVARKVINELEYQYRQTTRKAMCQAVFRVLEQYNIELWGYTSRTGQIKDGAKMPLSLHIYRVRRPKSEVIQNENRRRRNNQVSH